MSKFKAGNGYFLDKEEFSSVTFDKLWTKLLDYVNSNMQVSDTVKLNKDAGRITLTSEGSAINPIINIGLDNNNSISKSVIRIIQLNTSFNRLTKSLKLSSDNVENFSSYNTVSYQTACENKKVENLDSLFFHESALVDYTKNFNRENYLQCPYYLMMISFKTQMTICENSTGNTISKTFNDTAFVCYDSNTGKIISDPFSSLNSSSSLNVSEFISKYNSNLASLRNGFTSTTEKDGKTIICVYSDFKSAVSLFKLIHKDELEFINFKSFNSLIYERFISNLKSKLQTI